MNNCLFVTIYLYFKRGRIGKIDYRKSRFGWFPHFYYRENHHIINYVPLNPEQRKCPPPFFKGRLKFGDK